MKLHRYNCTDCKKPFFTVFAPLPELEFKNPAFCPCCGNDETVKFEEKTDIEVKE